MISYLLEDIQFLNWQERSDNWRRRKRGRRRFGIIDSMSPPTPHHTTSPYAHKKRKTLETTPYLNPDDKIPCFKQLTNAKCVTQLFMIQLNYPTIPLNNRHNSTTAISLARLFGVFFLFFHPRISQI